MPASQTYLSKKAVQSNIYFFETRQTLEIYSHVQTKNGAGEKGKVFKEGSSKIDSNFSTSGLLHKEYDSSLSFLVASRRIILGNLTYECLATRPV